ncbi:leucyl aminopeptidase family protein [Croceicoccus naphthovorans]|uniref:Cytosol aminopeptidase n=1 Tax=Croceicoccus naphthovorans TaxID=1348774 RepID=A0A0G3XJJ0_9SPHN|nr:leucyl aminopeptidase family protein [Croceicoccus naphthovorans]AKM10769.1 cytosol aminopeptidase [Croceicoccus naphthovorans]MBB3988968.1 leucyl aminopeptidase [Croceicoccus naphthovorans]
MTDKDELIQPDRGQDAISIQLVDTDGFDDWAKKLSGPQRNALAAQKFTGKGYQTAIVPDGDNWFAVGGVANPDDLSSWCMAKLAATLPAGTYRLASGTPGPALFGWLTAQYRFDRYRSRDEDSPVEGSRVLLTKDAATIPAVMAEAEATMLVRDLVNTPAEDMGPEALEAEANRLAKQFSAHLTVTRGDALEKGFPMVHAVGRAAARSHAPRLIELEWGKADAPRIAIVGKGVCFDSGGLDIKPTSGMALMKKDMGGAAHALALASLVMERNLPVRLHLLIPAVENAIAGNAFRPGDVLKSRKGLTVEVTNTDAEGRLVLGDALTKASEDGAELILDFATLTGAARVALGPDLPGLFAREDATADALLAAGDATDDPCWRLPLHDGYRDMLKSDIADMVNSASGGFAGATTAALFLDRFVGDKIDWVHLDTFAWRPAAKPGRSKGGAALGLRAAWGMLEKRYRG